MIWVPWVLPPWTLVVYVCNGCGPLKPLIVFKLFSVGDLDSILLCALSCHEGHCALEGESYQVLKPTEI